MGAGLLCELDGVLIEAGHGFGPERVRLLPGAATALRRLAQRGVPAVVVTDQPALGRGEADEPAFAALVARLHELLAAAGTQVVGVHHCPAAGPDRRRKPRPGLLLEAARAHGLDLAASWLVGRSAADAEAAAQAGCAGVVLLGTALPEGLTDLGIPANLAADLADAPRAMVPRGGGCWHDPR